MLHRKKLLAKKMEMGPFLISVIIRKDEINKALRWKKNQEETNVPSILTFFKLFR